LGDPKHEMHGKPQAASYKPGMPAVSEPWLRLFLSAAFPLLPLLPLRETPPLHPRVADPPTGGFIRGFQSRSEIEIEDEIGKIMRHA